MSSRKTIFFDVCGTLTRTNNTLCFVNFVLKKSSGLKYLVFKSLVLFDVIYDALKLKKLFKYDILRMGAISLLRGYAVDEVADMAMGYTAEITKKELYNKDIITILLDDKFRGNRIILLSACIDPPVTAIARKFDIREYYCSALETVGGHYTGKLSKDLLGRKDRVLNTIEDFIKDDSIFYTDNREDAVLHDQFGLLVMLAKDNDYSRVYSGNHDNIRSLRLSPCESRRANGDLNSINNANHVLSYIPTFYYILSRFHVAKTIALVLRNIIPIWLTVYLFGKTGLANSLGMVSLSFIIYYSMYEIGGLFNDINAKNERSNNPMPRISDSVHINIELFVAIRIAIFVLYLYYLKLSGYPVILYAVLTLLCIAVYLVHTKLINNLRLITFVLLQLFCQLIPLVVFSDIIPYKHIFLAYSIIIVPKRLYEYITKRESTKNIFENKFWAILYYVMTIVMGAIAFRATSIPIYIILPAYLFFLDSLFAAIKKYRVASLFYNLDY